MSFLQSIRLSGFLSFPPDSPTIELSPLNVLIGPNGSGKSNLLEAFELLRAAPTGLAAFIRAGGTAQEWVWKGEPAAGRATIDLVVNPAFLWDPEKLHYRLAFAASDQRISVLGEVIEDFKDPNRGSNNLLVYYDNDEVVPVINVADLAKPSLPRPSCYTVRELDSGSLRHDESVLSQIKDPVSRPEITWLGQRFASIQTFRDWTFGRAAPLRRPQRGDLPIDTLLDNSDNLGLVLNELQISNVNSEFNRLLSRFLPRFDRFSTRIQGNTVQFFLHEKGLGTPVPATRLSDGTIRFMAILAVLLSPSPPPLATIEEPELGLHPDAVSLLADVMVEASSRTQIIVTTHSDAFVSALSEHAGSVIVCENLRGTTLERLDPDKLEFWLDKYRLGEIWRIGEIGGQPVKNIKIYVEGGGDTGEQQAQIRAGLEKLLQVPKELAQQRRIKWKLIPRGERGQTYEAFEHAFRQADDETLVVLLVDSEEAIAPEVDGDPERNATVRKEHLVHREPSWDMRGIPPSQIHLMVQCMEAWIVADPEALAGFYGKDFHGRDLPVRRNLEDEPKPAVYEKLARATRDCQKGPYGKIRHASKLLVLISPVKVADRCPRFKTLTEWLTAEIEAV